MSRASALAERIRHQTTINSSSLHSKFMAAARHQAEKSYAEGGIPVGSILVRGGDIVGQGHNRRVQQGNPILHGEMDCLLHAGRQHSYRDTTLYTTLSPCLMCSGTIVQFSIPRVIIGENKTFGGNEDFLRSRGVDVTVLNDVGCRRLMGEFIREYPEIWAEDIGK